MSFPTCQLLKLWMLTNLTSNPKVGNKTEKSTFFLSQLRRNKVITISELVSLPLGFVTQHNLSCSTSSPADFVSFYVCVLAWQNVLLEGDAFCSGDCNRGGFQYFARYWYVSLSASGRGLSAQSHHNCSRYNHLTLQMCSWDPDEGWVGARWSELGSWEVENMAICPLQSGW